MDNHRLIREPFNVISNKLSDINFYKNFIEGNKKRSIKDNSEQKEIMDKLELKNSFKQSSSFSCYSPYDGMLRILGNKTDTVESGLKTIEYHYNQQCQWLLVEAHEEFERYLNNLYSSIGYIDNSFWCLKDFGNISLDEIKNKDQKWFLQQVKNKPKKPNSILNQFRKKIPNISTLESKNKLNVPLKLIIIIIEKTRHIIVHNEGATENKKDFIESIIKDAGLFNNGKYNSKIFNNISKFFDDDDEYSKIRLKTIYNQGKNNFGINVEHNYDGFNDLLNNLGSYLMIIQHETEEYLRNKSLISDKET